MKTVSEKEFQIVVENIHKTIPYGFDEGQAIVYGVFINDDLGIQFEQITSGSDIYELIYELTDNPIELKDYDIFTTATAGWAAPINNDNGEELSVPPSRHPDRRRCRLFSNTHSTGMVGSSVMFKDEPEEPIYDYGDARGSLADALMQLFKSIHN